MKDSHAGPASSGGDWGWFRAEEGGEMSYLGSDRQPINVLILFTGLLLLWTASTQAAVITVNSTADSGAGTLREAIDIANATPGLDTIHFNIPGAGPHTIQPLSSLPLITYPVVIDGYSQAGSSQNSLPDGDNAVLLIELDGSAAPGTPFDPPVGLFLRTSNSTVRGLVINQFLCDGIVLQGDGNVVEGNFIGTDVTGMKPLGNATNVAINGFLAPEDPQPGSKNQIGGTAPGARNIISDGERFGIVITGASDNLVQGNFIGTDVTGTQPLGNHTGVRWIGAATNNIIGGTAPGAGNLISGNKLGVVSQDCCGGGNRVRGNFIGTDVTGTAALGNNTGVLLKTPDEIIGGTAPGAGNLISGNFRGVNISGSGATGNVVQGNYIGTDVTGAQALGNSSSGVRINTGASNNRIGGTDGGAANIIAFNELHGVLVASGTENGILSNAIFGNTLRGIDLGNNAVTPNDLGDADSGANNLQNFPVLDTATTGSVEGTLNSTPSTDFTIQFFANQTCDPSGFGEGETLLGSTRVTTDGFGDANFTRFFPVPLGQVITATATDPDNNTSEFSSCDVEVETVEVAVDIHPTGCPNPLNVNGRGIIPVAILGTLEFDVTQIDPTSVRLEGVAPLRSSLEDVATPFEPLRGKADLFDCTDLGPDGFQDLTLKFDRSELIAAIGEVNDGDGLVLHLIGSLNDGSGILGEDVVIIRK